LRKQGYVIGVVGDLYQLGAEPVSTEALSSGEQRTFREAGLSRLHGGQAGDSASVDTQLTLLPSDGLAHYDDGLGRAA
jgi:hypothetical protein